MSDHDLARLKESVGLLGGEVLLEGWAAMGEHSGESVLGLVLVTNYRLIFTEVGDFLTAFPIAKIHAAEVHSPTRISLSAWYGRLVLTFDNPGTSSAVLNVLRQDSNWNAVEVNLTRQLDWAAGMTLAGAAPIAPLPARPAFDDDAAMWSLKAG